MEKKYGAFRLGLFVIIGAAMVIIAIFVIGDKEAMFSKTFEVKAYFSNIEGLRSGAVVRLNGISVGSVKDIKISGDSVSKVEVRLKLSSDIKKYLRKDATASIENEGLVGNKVLVLNIGTSSAPQLEDGDVIIGLDPLGFAAIISETQGTLYYIKDMTKNLAEIVAKVNEGEGSIGRLINRTDLYDNTNRLVVTADKSLQTISLRLDTLSLVVNELTLGVQSIVSNVDRVVIDIDTIVNKIQKGEGLLGILTKDNSKVQQDISSIVTNLLSISEDTKLGAARFAENMEADRKSVV